MMDKNKNIKKHIVLGMCLFMIVALAIEISILSTTNKKQVYKTSNILIEQVDNILASNRLSEEETIKELREDYIERAHTVSYILEHDNEAAGSVDKLKKIAKMMSIDEINLFNDEGVIYGGTVPEYYGISFDSGEQVSFFKSMLDDKSLSMCQDVTPNTAESKSMMYAIVWDHSGTYMIQVGIEPVRLLNELRRNSIHEVISQMPVYEGLNIYVADANSGEIHGSTDKLSVGKSIYETGIISPTENIDNLSDKSIHLNGYRHYCFFKQNGDYIIAVVHSTRANISSFIVSILIEVVWLLLAGSIILYTLFKLVNAGKRIQRQMSILESISDIYYSMHLIDMSDLSIERLESNDFIDRVVKEGSNAQDMLERAVGAAVEDEYKEAVRSFIDMSTLRERMRNRQTIFIDAIDKNVGWLRISFITVEADKANMPVRVIIATQIIEEDKKREEELAIKANRDELTGLLNRRAYEDDLLNYPDVPPEQDFVYAAIDINGLKVVNDELGHAAGDELIQGAAACLKRSLGNYGRVYRTGGDEFVSIFFADESHFKSLLKELEYITASWEGEIVKELSLSIGCVTKREFGKETVEEMSKIADQRMYKVKADYYSRKGVDRRGQAAAHTALCNLYTKILKVNLTNDTYSIVNMDASEQTISDKISRWLAEFGKSGQVHEDDLKDYLERTDLEYLKEYFRKDNSSITILYRRRYSDDYKQAVMEMIPANDYSDDNQSLFLYVKTFDK